MTLKSENRRVEVPLSQAQYEVLQAHAKGKGLATVIRKLLIEHIPEMPDDLKGRGKHDRNTGV